MLSFENCCLSDLHSFQETPQHSYMSLAPGATSHKQLTEYAPSAFNKTISKRIGKVVGGDDARPNKAKAKRRPFSPLFSSPHSFRPFSLSSTLSSTSPSYKYPSPSLMLFFSPLFLLLLNSPLPPPSPPLQLCSTCPIKNPFSSFKGAQISRDPPRTKYITQENG